MNYFCSGISASFKYVWFSNYLISVNTCKFYLFSVSRPKSSTLILMRPGQKHRLGCFCVMIIVKTGGNFCAILAFLSFFAAFCSFRFWLWMKMQDQRVSASFNLTLSESSFLRSSLALKWTFRWMKMDASLLVSMDAWLPAPSTPHTSAFCLHISWEAFSRDNSKAFALDFNAQDSDRVTYARQLLLPLHHFFPCMQPIQFNCYAIYKLL